jgi:hypothetical protein
MSLARDDCCWAALRLPTDVDDFFFAKSGWGRTMARSAAIRRRW